jgi:hypothetical protein
VAKADEKAISSRYITLAQAAERIGREELRFLLEEGRLLALDRENQIECEKLARHPYRQRHVQTGASEVDVKAIDAIARGALIPPATWRRWFQDGVVNLETGEIVRTYVDRAMVFRPVLRSEDVPAQADQAPPKAVKGSRQQQLILRMTEEEFPDGYEQVSTSEIFHRVGEQLKRQKLPVPGRTTFERALGRRKN